MRVPISILLFAILLPGFSSARTWYVPSEVPTIQAGIDTAAAGDVVEIACGQYPEHDIILKSGITVRGESGSADCVILDLDQSGRGFYGYEVWHVVIEGITVQDGVEIYGAGIYSEYSQLILRNCAFKRGDAIGDGAISALRSTMEFENCEFVANNSFNDGAGAIFSYESDVTFTDCVFADNTGEGSSGGLWITSGQVDLVNCLQ